MTTVLFAFGAYFLVVAIPCLAIASIAEWRHAPRKRRGAAARRLARDVDAVIADYELRCPRLHLVQTDEVSERRMRRERTGGAA